MSPAASHIAGDKAQTILLSLLLGTAVFRGNNSLLCAKPVFGGVSGLFSVLLFLGLEQQAHSSSILTAGTFFSQSWLPPAVLVSGFPAGFGIV